MAREDSLLWIVVDGLLKWLKTRHAMFSILGTLGLMIALAWLFSYQAEAFPAQDPYNVEPTVNGGTGPSNAEYLTETQSGRANEGQSMDETFDLVGDVIWIMDIALSFTDEQPDRSQRFTNEPDTFEVTILFPDGESETKSASSSYPNTGTILFNFNWTSDGGIDWTDDGGNFVVATVSCTEAGNQHPLFNPFGFREVEDTGNDYTLSVYCGFTEYD
jgi:hypothetical protein